jgi:endonuclease/exonuclease/phosphatase family metal-dependent hydrolase
MVRPSSELITKNLAGLQGFLGGVKADFTLLQEVDSNSKRSRSVDEVAGLRAKLGQSSAYAMNFSANYVPYPWPPIGKVHSGLVTFSQYKMAEATRISLPCPFSWPMSMVNLKRCLLVSRIPLEGSDKELVLVNLHLEAYDDGEGKLAQSKQLREFVEQEYAKGNYVIAGGDWNQLFPDTEKLYPNKYPELWVPGYLDEAELSAGWQYVWDDSVPTCRLLNQPYDKTDTENTQYYVIDGFLVSPNLKVESVETMDEGFAFSDHNPVLLSVSLGE